MEVKEKISRLEVCLLCAYLFKYVSLSLQKKSSVSQTSENLYFPNFSLDPTVVKKDI